MSACAQLELACLRALLGSLGARGQALAELHPRANDLRSAAEGPAALDELWWSELEQLEREAGLAPAHHAPARTDANYYLRRRDLARWTRWRDVAARLDRTWRCLLEWPASRARDACIRVGLRAIASAAVSVPRHELSLWLRPLGAQRAHDVLQLVIHRQPPTPELAAQVSLLTPELALERRGDSLLSALGRRVLAARLRASVDLAAIDSAGVGSSDLLRLLRLESPLTVTSAAENRTIDGWIAQLVN